MNSLVADRTNLMIDNFHKLKHGFRWEANLVKHFIAMSLAIDNRKSEMDNLLRIRDYIRSHTSWVSYFRGTNELILVNLLSGEENYPDVFNNVQAAYELMKRNGFRSSPYLPMAAYVIASTSEKAQWNKNVERMIKFYEGMKKNHFWITSPDDYVYAAILATTDFDIEETLNKIEKYYDVLNKDGFYKGNALQTLSHILALSEGNVEDNCRRTIALYKKLKGEKCKLRYDALATLGLLALVSTDVDTLVSEIKEVYDYIHSVDGYGFWSLDTSNRTMIAASIVSSYYIDNIKNGILQISVGNSINAILIAQQQAAAAAACAAAASASAASS
ncbi:DUF4003 family protein [Clostridium fungisolvens]|uniref:DUF4003 domain-containing protein n=1 Tax=Clostridium fungisolvens TaxID=1604897 RepID=A0A6V8SK31_9CLOT|nr:DUF4003 family protein [Clostridium fungisolvens]GFP76905.1 hypothetical protein bsdtw1_03016 [Clostridium fungisolvens]